MPLLLTSPHTPAEFAAYYRLRYEVLRQPWGQPPGSEQAEDDHAPTTLHTMLTDEQGQVVGVARLSPGGPEQAQVRYMAVAPAYQGRGLGRQLLGHLEAQARLRGFQECMLHARQAAVPFYEQLGYSVVAPSHTLFGTIPHFLMRKAL
jgi:GNAT superfamily N-acetyltransferase